MDGFTFFKSYHDSAQHLSKKDQSLFYKMIIDYIFKSEEPTATGHIMGFWLLTKPTLDKSIARAKSGQTQIKTKSNPNQKTIKPKVVTSEEKEKEKDKDKEYKKSIKKDFTFNLSGKQSFDNLSEEYIDNLNRYIITSEHIMTFEHFRNTCLANGYKYKNFSLAYLNWAKKNTDNPHISKHTSQTTTNSTIDKFFNGAESEIIDARIN